MTQIKCYRCGDWNGSGCSCADGQTVILGDCREVLPEIDAGCVDLVLTDPPYGMNYKPKRGSDGSKRFVDSVIGDDEPFNPQPLLIFRAVILWGANWYASRLPDSGGWLVWDKTPRGIKNGFIASHAELAWTNFNGRNLKFSQQWGGEAHGGEGHFHPTQKSTELMKWCIEQAGEPQVILDPFAGSFTTARAAKDLGRKSICIELEEKYVEIGCRRLEQGVLDFEGATA